MLKFDIATIGTATMDTFLELSQICYKKDPAHKKNYYCFPVGGKTPITNLIECFGGNAVNTAVGFSRLGLKTSIISSIDLGLRSQHLISYLQKAKVATNYIKASHGTPLNLSYILDWHKDKNDRVVLSHHRPKDFHNIKWPKTDWIYLTSLGEHHQIVTPQLPPKIKIAFTPGGWELAQGPKFLLDILSKTEILILNQEEAAALANIHFKTSRRRHRFNPDYEFLFKNLLKLGPYMVVITGGRYGAGAQSIDQPKFIFEPGLKVRIQEVTGAGDAFATGFITAYIKGYAPQTCLRWGSLNSAACIREIGAQNGLLKFGELQREYRIRYRRSK